VKPLEDLENAYMGGTTGTPTGEHEADAWAMWRRLGRNNRAIGYVLGTDDAPTRKPQTCENITEDPETGPDRPW
jgi:hypothetical protein